MRSKKPALEDLAIPEDVVSEEAIPEDLAIPKDLAVPEDVVSDDTQALNPNPTIGMSDLELCQDQLGKAIEKQKEIAKAIYEGEDRNGEMLEVSRQILQHKNKVAQIQTSELRKAKEVYKAKINEFLMDSVPREISMLLWRRVVEGDLTTYKLLFDDEIALPRAKANPGKGNPGKGDPGGKGKRVLYTNLVQTLTASELLHANLDTLPEGVKKAVEYADIHPTSRTWTRYVEQAQANGALTEWKQC